MKIQLHFFFEPLIYNFTINVTWQIYVQQITFNAVILKVGMYRPIVPIVFDLRFIMYTHNFLFNCCKTPHTNTNKYVLANIFHNKLIHSNF